MFLAEAHKLWVLVRQVFQNLNDRVVKLRWFLRHLILNLDIYFLPFNFLVLVVIESLLPRYMHKSFLNAHARICTGLKRFESIFGDKIIQPILINLSLVTASPLRWRC